MRKGWIVTWSDGTRWFGDCEYWAEENRKAGHKVTPMRILGKKRSGHCCKVHGY